MDNSGENMADSNDDEIIELTQVAEDTLSEEAEDVIDLTQVAETEPEALVLEDALTPEPASEEAADTEEASSGETGASDMPALGRKELEAAIERVIERKFSQQIEQILFEVTETVIKREIADIKAGLQKDLDDIDNA